ncbi:motility associated factor glycosyltransferase family protein [Treponema sp.]|uniref:motility associated factor glycosyltransferase family protein n=1 Tax=Treponema sp. TaxID=166 RepID=UPI003EFD6907
MNSIWNKNSALFRERFPQLCLSLRDESSDQTEFENAKNGSLTAKHRGILLHSKYNPEKEASVFIDSFNPEKKDTAVFLGFGLGYAPVEFARRFPEKTLVLIENDTGLFFAALHSIDWQPVFSHEKLILLIGAEKSQAESFLSGYSYSRTQLFRTKAQTLHSQDYFDSLEAFMMQNKEKEDVNTNTLEKFSHLWLSNSCKNAHFIETLDGVNKFSGAAAGLPFVILAAGPSLKKILPHLQKIKERAILVCVDTALHSCIEFNVEPDFIILADPQYYCSVHLEFLKSLSSVLITEIAVYPSVFRFQCREKVLFSSMFPIGKYFEKRMGEKGKLASGGSVTTTAWDFARLCGAKEIFIAGMDLGFPGKETHIRGSKFEEKIHAESSRTKSAESKNLASLFSAAPFFAENYNGEKILTDKRMSLFSWWFEKNCETAASQGTKTFSLTPESLAVKGIEKFSLQEFLSKPCIKESRNFFFEKSQENRKNYEISGAASFEQAQSQFLESLKTLEFLAARGTEICSQAINGKIPLSSVCQMLNKIDMEISTSSAKEAAALVFPTQRQLDSLSEKIPNKTSDDKKNYAIHYSNLIYSELLASISLYKKFFPNSNKVF